MRKMPSISLPRFYVAAMEKESDGTASSRVERTPLLVERDGTVLDGSEEVFANGVEVGMPVRKALRLAPARVVPADISLAKPLFRRAIDELAASLCRRRTGKRHVNDAGIDPIATSQPL